MSSFSERETQRRLLEQQLIASIATARDDLFGLRDEIQGHWGYEDGLYRFYHQSFKVFFLQMLTDRIVAALQNLLPEQPLNDWFLSIVREGTGKKFDIRMNKHWLQETRPIVEAFCHAKYFLEMVCRFADEIKEPQQLLPSGWASVLYLYGLR
ncbi:MAG: hypothetical protein R3C59_24330 [Planctomycetaceae bacterium]